MLYGMKRADVVGQTFGFLTVIADAPDRHRSFRVQVVSCVCGTIKTVSLNALRKGEIKSCGCMKVALGIAANTRHGYSAKGGRAEYNAWGSMRERCHNPRHHSYSRYGGRGITVCDWWRSDFANFLADMGPRPSPAHSLDRIDNNGNYEPGNCRWATIDQQASNKRTNVKVSAFGETLHMREWSRRTGLSASGIKRRLAHGWSPERALSEPARGA
jgi:hypothetical protein